MRASEEADLERSLELPYLIAAGQRQRLDLVHHLLEFGNQMVVIQGDLGSGRTRMLECICSEAEATWTVVEAHDEIESPESLLRFLAQSLSIRELTDDDNIEGSITRIREELVRLENDRCLCVLVIDDAERLSDELCVLLFTLAHAQNGAGELRILLTGSMDSDFSGRLQQMAPTPSLVHLVDIPPLNPTQIDALVQSFAQAAGQGDVFADLDRTQLTLDARGNPAATIAALYELLDVGSATDVPAAAPQMGNYPRYALLSLALLIGAAAVLFIGVGSRQNKLEEREIALPNKEPETGSQAVPAAQHANTATAEIKRVDTRAAGPVTLVPISAPPAERPVETLDMTAADHGPITAQVQTTTSDGVRDPDPYDAADTLTQTETAVAPEAIPLAPPSAETTPAPARQEATQPAQSTFDYAANKPTDTGITTAASYNREWVLTQDPQSYVLQFIGVRDRSAAMRFMEAHELASRSTVIELAHEGAPWFVLVFGHFPDRDAAVAAINDLAPALSRLKPWARPVHSLRN